MRDLTLPPELRDFFKRPFGELLRGVGLQPAQEVKDRLKEERVVAIGDVTYRNLLAVGVRPSLAVVDLKTKRTQAEPPPEGGGAIKVTNPPGMITQALWDGIKEGLLKEGSIILVDGEEDLAVLPCILEAELDTIILYGQPDEGIVFIRVTQEKKEDVASILKLIYSR